MKFIILCCIVMLLLIVISNAEIIMYQDVKLSTDNSLSFENQNSSSDGKIVIGKDKNSSLTIKRQEFGDLILKEKLAGSVMTDRIFLSGFANDIILLYNLTSQSNIIRPDKHAQGIEVGNYDGKLFLDTSSRIYIRKNVSGLIYAVVENRSNETLTCTNITYNVTTPSFAAGTGLDGAINYDVEFNFSQPYKGRIYHSIYDATISTESPIWENVDYFDFITGNGGEITEIGTNQYRLEFNPRLLLLGNKTLVTYLEFSETAHIIGGYDDIGQFIPYYAAHAILHNTYDIYTEGDNYSIGEQIRFKNGANITNDYDNTIQIDSILNISNKTISPEYCFSDGSCLLSKYKVKLSKSTNQSISGNNVWINITWDTESFDVGDMFNVTASNLQITIKRSNYYSLGYNIKMSSQDKILYETRILKNYIQLNGSWDIIYGSKDLSSIKLRASDNTFFFNSGDNITLQIRHDDSIPNIIYLGESYFQIKEEY